MNKKAIKFKHDKNNNKILIDNAVCYYFNGNQFNKLRGYEFDLVWIDELCKIKYQQELWNQLQMCTRIGQSKFFITTTPIASPFFYKLLNFDRLSVTYGTSFENNSLSERFKNNIEEIQYTDFGKQEILGQIDNRNIKVFYDQPKYIYEYFIGIDPAVSNGTTGIIVTTRSEQKWYIVEDLSTTLPPNRWMQSIKNFIEEKKIKTTIICERNQGGNFIPTLAQYFNMNFICKYTNQHKIIRQNQVIYMYKNLEIFHCKPLPALEDEILYPKDRIDALYLSLSEYEENLQKINIY